MSHKYERMIRIKTIKAMIEKANKVGNIVDEAKLVAVFCLDYNAGKRYVKEYLSDLELAGVIVRYDGKLWLKEYFNKEKYEQQKAEREAIDNLEGGDY